MTTKPETSTEQDDEIFASLGLERPPSEDEIPWSDDMPMDSERQALQMDLLFEALRRYVEGRDIYVGKNQTVWYSSAQVRNRDFLGPDVYVALDVSPHERKGWAIWLEGKAPDIAIEILSPTTAARDRGEKKRIYQDNIGVREYFWWDPETGELAGFRLNGRGYLPVEPDAEGRLPCVGLDLLLTRWDGVYMQRGGPWLRWATRDGQVLPTAAEAERQRAERERERAESERERAESERERAEEMEALLRRYRERFGELPE